MFANTLYVLAIVTGSPSTPTPAPSITQQDCQYSAMINNNSHRPIYKCYTEEEWTAKQAADTQASQEAAAKQSESLLKTLDWLIANWWKVILWCIAGFIILFIFFCIYDTWDRKIHPWKYDYFGFRKDDFNDSI